MMIDFSNPKLLKLKPANISDCESLISPLLVESEEIMSVFKTVRDSVIFTNKRIIAVNVQGITGKKKDFTSLPYSKIQAFSVETSGIFDLDSELQLWFSGMGKVCFEFVSQANVSEICRLISNYVL